jgi:hypothetical protein
MNLPAVLYSWRWLIRDTFRQARASGLSWLMLGVSALCILVCLSVNVVDSKPLHRPGEPSEFLPRHDPQADPAKAAKSGVDVVQGDLTLAFGAFRIPLGRDAHDAIRFLQLLLAGAVADTAGILLALIWTAGFLPAFLDPSAAVVLLAKPVPRWSLLVGKYLGVLVFVFFQATVFVGGTWLALGLRTSVWDPGYLLCIPLLLLHFAIFFSFSLLLAVYTRSTIVCVVGSIAFWLLCWGMNYGRHAVVTLPYLDPSATPLPSLFQGVVEAGYWVLPKPFDLNIILSEALQAANYFDRFEVIGKVQEIGAFYPDLSVLSSLVFTAAMLLTGARELAYTDY